MKHCQTCGKIMSSKVNNDICCACRDKSQKLASYKTPRKNCATPGCNGTMKLNDNHAICSTCRKTKKKAKKSKADIQADAEQRRKDREWFERRANLTLTDPRARSIYSSIEWMFR